MGIPHLVSAGCPNPVILRNAVGRRRIFQSCTWQTLRFTQGDMWAELGGLEAMHG